MASGSIGLALIVCGVASADPGGQLNGPLTLSPNTVGSGLSAGTLIGTLGIADLPFGQYATYSLVAGTGDTDNALFTIIGPQVFATAPLDSTPTRSLRVRGVSSDSSVIEAALTITVTPRPTTGVFSGDFPLFPKTMWWHDEFVAHPTNGWMYGTCSAGGQSDSGMVFRVNYAGDYETLVHFTNNGTSNKGSGPAGRLTYANDGNFYGATGGGGVNNKGTVFKMTPSGELTTLAEFSGTSGNALGAEPTGGVIQGIDGNFYGTTQDGGTGNFGTVFKVTPAGVFTSLVSFTDLSGPNLGSFPNGTLAQDESGNLYGLTLWGGSNGKGTIFKMTTAGVLTTLISFTGTAGAALGQNPNGSLTRGADGNFYGMTAAGGTSNLGTIFKVTPAGALTTLVEFTGDTGANNGANPYADLTLGADGNFYGMTSSGGASGKGTIFKVTPLGDLTTLVEFTGNGSSNKGATPKGTLGLGVDGNFYGMTQNGGAADQGTVFKVTPTGTLTTLMESTGFYRGSTPKGAYPNGSVCVGPDGNFYGTTFYGGTADGGTIFKIDALGRRTVLVSFTGNAGANRGSAPIAGLVLAGDGNFYGTTLWGGASNLGTVFRMTPAGVHTTLVDFSGNSGAFPGAHPWCRLTVGPDGHLYAVTAEGGSNGVGVAFRITTDGVFTKLFDFTGVGGANPGSYSSAPFTLGPDGMLYSAQFSGGNNDYGTIYKMTTSGVMTVLVHLDTNTGGWPCGGLTFGPDSLLYGMTNDGGANDLGSVFKVTTTGTFTKLFDFTGISGANRGAFPLGTMFYAPDGFFYGATNSGGNHDKGTLFKMTTGGVMTVLTDFKGAGTGIESGGWPYNDEFALGRDGQLYGMTNVGGRQGGGLVYRIQMPVPEIAVSGNGQDIANNNATPSLIDHTSFGQIAVASGNVPRIFTIANTGGADLTLGTMTISGANAGDFTVSTPPSSLVAAGSSTTISISFDPSTTGDRTAQLSINTNDPDESPFTFAIAGTGNSPPTFAGTTINTVQASSLTISEATIRSNTSDADSQTLTITVVPTTSTGGFALVRSGSNIVWTPSLTFVGTDTFAVTISDGFATIQGTITIMVAADRALGSPSTLQVSLGSGNVANLSLTGVPGRVYGIQRSTNLVDWTQIAAPTANGLGALTFDDPTPPTPRAF